MKIDFEKNTILTDEGNIYLTKMQNNILNLLYQHKNNVVKYKEIANEVYGIEEDIALKRTIAKHISLLNKKVGKYILIKNIQKVGYALEEGFKGV